MKRALGWRGALPLLVALGLGILAACSSSEEATTTTTAPAATATTAAGSTTTTAAPEVTATEEAVVADTGPVYGGILYAAMENDAPGMSPMYDSSITRAYMWWPMYNRLWAADPLDMSQNVNDLVKEYTITNGGKTYNITLHEGVKFHNGETLTADDVKARYEIQECDLPEGRSAPKGTTSKLLTGYPDRDCDDFKSASPKLGIKIVDDTHIEWTLNRPSNSFTDYIYQHAVSPRSVLQKDDATPNMSGKEDTPEDNVGTGPFKYVEYQRGSVFKVEKFEDYWGTDPRNGNALPYLDGIHTYVIPDASTRFAAFRNGNVEITQDNFRPITFSQARVIEDEMEGKATVKYDFGATNAFMAYNHVRTPWDDVNMRTALHLALDRDDICEVLAEGNCVYATHMPPFLPSRFGDALNDEPGYRQPKTEDIAAAEALMDAAGYTVGADGNRLSVELPVRPTSRYQDLALVLQDQLKKVNVELRLNPMELGAFDRRRRSRDFDLLPITGVTSTLHPMQGHAGYWQAGNGYNCEYDERDTLQEAADSAALGSTEYTTNIVALEKSLMDYMCAYTPTVWLDYPLGVWNHINDYPAHKIRYDTGPATHLAWKDAGT